MPIGRLDLAHAALLALATGAAWAAAAVFLRAPCWAALLLVAALAWPIWRYQAEYALFARRALLAGVMHEASRVRRWLWAGQLARGWQVPVAILWAIALLALSRLLGPWHWLALAVDAVLLGLLVGPVTRRLESDVRSERAAMVARRWPLAWVNVAALALAFLAIDFLVGSADTRGLAWHAVAERSFAAVHAASQCEAAGAVAGAAAAVDALAWHASQVIIPSLPHPGLQVAAWGLFLLQAGAVALAMTRLHLGLAATLDRRVLRGEAAASAESAPESSRAFLAVVAVLAVAYLAATAGLGERGGAWLERQARQAVAWADPCRTDAATLAQLEARLGARLQVARVEEQQRAGEDIDAAVERLYGDVEQGVDRYLDWYFTVIGEYQRLGALLTGRFAEEMTRELEERLFGAAFGERLEQASREVAAASAARLNLLAGELGAQVGSGARAHPCWAGRVDLAALGRVERD
ncbi:MAG TPA: hypothetical protein VLC53_08150, partial [Myxococcota bacterium]|nr:hypothetical protein [Myxococcota bacterium]